MSVGECQAYFFAEKIVHSATESSSRRRTISAPMGAGLLGINRVKQTWSASTANSRQRHITARGKSPATFKRRCIPAELRCSSVEYVQYAPSSRLVSRAPRRSRCHAGFHHGLIIFFGRPAFSNEFASTAKGPKPRRGARCLAPFCSGTPRAPFSAGTS